MSRVLLMPWSVVARRTRSFQWLIGLSVGAIAALAGCTVVPLGDAGPGPGGSDGSFDATRYVAERWDTSIVPTIVEQAVDLSTLSAAITSDPNAAGQQYGNREGAGNYSFMVAGVAMVDGAAPGGLVLDAGLGATAPEVILATGPVITSTAVRDAVGLIHFSDFATQLEYADVADALNAHVKALVIRSLDPQALVGKRIAFVGAFTLADPTRYLIVPVKIEQQG